jgi:hypothetical protein
MGIDPFYVKAKLKLPQQPTLLPSNPFLPTIEGVELDFLYSHHQLKLG